ncbi:DNA mismatch repair endonuclease MutL [Candidatus Kapabacteria bacterium]|nr:DNA mismatch repair endonuclease MutL [Candidatus Kapabacteria bacterium]
MTNIINILPDFIANQIAAGEVVQRPESVIKELIENSLDAKSSNIHITIRDAGKSLIHIVDNGVGMSKSDLLLSIKRHATSKILTNKDLEAIKSFGFRGEALASISAVAKLEIITKQKNDTLGWKLISEPNKEINIEPVDTSIGTQILVKNLFFNTPARRKFLRANLTEYRHILDTINKFGLANPNIQLSFYDDNNLIYKLENESLKNRITNILGKKVFNNLINIDFKNDFIKISGFIGSPNIAKVSRSGQYLFLNTRSINNKSLNHAISSAFGPLLDRNQHPVFIIFLEINPEEIDINVHPQKHEVKFEDERAIYNTLKHAVQLCLRTNDMTSEFVFKNQQAEQPFIENKFDNNQIINKTTGEIIDKYEEQPDNQINNTNNSTKYPTNEFAKQSKNNFTKEISVFDSIFSDSILENSTNFGYFQVHDKYIITQNEKGILVIDQHNAHERINYEKAILMLDKELSKSQQMLFPETFELDKKEITILEEIKDELIILGFQFSLNNNKIEIFGKPTEIENGNEEKDLKEILSKFEENQELGRTNKRENIAASYSCRSAIKTGKKLNYDEMKNLHQNLMKCDTPEVCPHGRPVIMEITLKELDLQFGRTPKYD